MSLDAGAEFTPLAVFPETPALTARELRTAETLRAVQMVAEMTGDELVVESVTDPSLITDRPGVYVFGNHLGGNAGNIIRDVNFVMQDKPMSGAADSAHAVIAGWLDVTFNDRPSEGIKVVAKCFAKRTPEERFERAIREVTIMEELAGRHELSLEPIALAIAPKGLPMDGQIILFSRQEDELLTFDNQPWGRGPSNQRNADSGRTVAAAIGRFNAKYGLRHGDAKAKNCAEKYGKNPGMIDYETTVRFDKSDPFESSLTAEIDFGLMVDSLSKKGFLPLTSIDAYGRRNAVPRPIYRATCQMLQELAFAYLTEWESVSVGVQEAVTAQVSIIIDNFIESQIG
ncbi:MAG: hypothetical protein ABI221_00365 [Candidatus Saccharimonadales bacterium]